MKKTLLSSITIVVVSVAISLTLVGGASDAFAKSESKNFVAPLSGDQEVSSVDTKATGLAKFQVNKDNNGLEYNLIVANIDNIVQAHIHCGPQGSNGPVVAFLFGPEAEGVNVNGILAQGTLSDGDIIPRDVPEVCPEFDGTLDELLAEMRSGNTYVNVHTITNPSGEIRGQIAEAGPSK